MGGVTGAEALLCALCPLKGVFHVYDEVKTMVADLQLGDKASLQANCLSGGMKRKLRYSIMRCSF